MKKAIRSMTALAALLITATATAQVTYPEDGWWWNPDAPGRGYLIERQENVIFIASFHYAQDGRPEWLSIQGSYTPGESGDSIGEFNGTVFRSTNRQCLGRTHVRGVVSRPHDDRFR